MMSLKRESLFNGPVASACMRIAYSGCMQAVQRLRARGVSHKELEQSVAFVNALDVLLSYFVGQAD
jgi:hypothetical protein